MAGGSSPSISALYAIFIDMIITRKVVASIIRKVLKEELEGVHTKTISQKEMQKLEWDGKVALDKFFTGGIGDIHFPVVMVGDIVVGIAKIWKGTMKKYPFHAISMIAIAPEYQGKGYATMLVDEMFRFAKEKNLTLGVYDYTKDGWTKLKALFNEKAKQHGVRFIDTESKILSLTGDNDWGEPIRKSRFS